MNALYLAILVTLVSPVSHAGGITDPWGKREDTAHLRANRDDANARLAAARADLASQTKRQTEVRAKIMALKEKIQKLKGESLKLVFTDNQNLATLLENQNEQLSRTLNLQIQAADVQKRLNAAVTSMANLNGQAQAMRILEPLFENTATNRMVWDLALRKMLESKNLTPEDYKAIAQFRVEVQAADDWFWKRPFTLVTDFSKTLEGFASTVTQNMTTALIEASNELVASLQVQMQLQIKLTEALQKMKSSHDQMTNALSPGSLSCPFSFFGICRS